MKLKPNHSHFIRKISGESSVDFEQLWQDTMACKPPEQRKRAFDDMEEKRFWEKFYKQYDVIPSLMDYAPHVLDRLLAHTGKGKTMIEIGCGTGKFTLPMLDHARHITAVDFSSHMLTRLSGKITPLVRPKLTLVHSKWETCNPPRVDCVFSINAIYRMTSIRSALAKMGRAAREKVVIIWTMQRSVFDQFINQFHKTGLERNQEYIHLLALLYEMGIDPDLEFIPVYKPVTIDRDVAKDELRSLAHRHGLPCQQLIAAFEKAATRRQGQYSYSCPLRVALIHWTPEPH